MIFVFLDDRTLDVVGEKDDLCGKYEGIDVENGVYEFFDEDLHKMVPEFLVPNMEGFLGTVNGTYELRVSIVERDRFLSRLATLAFVNPNPWFKNIEEIRRFAEKKG